MLQYSSLQSIEINPRLTLRILSSQPDYSQPTIRLRLRMPMIFLCCILRLSRSDHECSYYFRDLKTNMQAAYTYYS